jgi:hypothetical protein
MTLAEVVVALGVAGLVAAVIASFGVFFARSLATVMNHIEVETQSRLALDTVSREVRRASSVTGIVTNSLTLQVGPNRVTYAYDSEERTLTRVERDGLGIVQDTRVFLRDCDSASFEIYQRNATNATYDIYPVASTNDAKIVRLRWSMSRKIFGQQQSVETVSSARIVIRKKST